MLQTNLALISKQIINSASISEEIQSAKLLSEFFSELNSITSVSINQKTDTILPGGIAISYDGAAICVNDYLRTTRFIKGVYHAMEDLLAKFPFTKSSILYAGCGPYATLLLPLLPLFAEDDFNITLLDINETSINSVETLIQKLGLQNYHVKTVCGNAITYKHKHAEETPLHLVITETMFNALTREPQVAVTANLAPQLAEDGILIPEEISLNAAYSFFAYEPFLKNEANAFVDFKKTPAYAKQQSLDTLFSMNKRYNFADKAHHNNYIFESPFYKLPQNFTEHPDVCIYTNIRIYKDLTLGLAESYITNPYCVSSLYGFTNCTHFKLVYNFKEVPNWTYVLQ